MCLWNGTGRLVPSMASYSTRPAPTYGRSTTFLYSGYKKDTGLTRCGASLDTSRSRSLNASQTSLKSNCSRYRRPPWISLLDRLEVPEARSRASTRATRRPRDAASRAAPAPVIPPPMTSTSNRSAASRPSVALRSRASRTPLLAITHSPISLYCLPLGYVHRQSTRKPRHAGELPFTRPCRNHVQGGAVADFVGAVDQGTTSTRFMVFDHSGSEVARHQLEHTQLLPRPGWVEHNPVEIWERTSAVIQTVLNTSNLNPDNLAALGLTNQRETTVVWNRRTGRPYANAIVWQDTRTDAIAAALDRAESGQKIRLK